VQTGSQRTNGFEFGLSGYLTPAWQIAGGYAYQDAFVTSDTASARAGAQVAQVPHHSFSLWNNYRFHPRLALALGIVRRSDMFAAIDNTVVLPRYTRADLATYVTLRDGLRLQAHLDNVFDANYFVNADSNTNISPGSPRALRLALLVVF
jgi:catecholate siderophore receptor